MKKKLASPEKIVNVKELEKGNTIGPDFLEQAFDAHRESKSYRLQLMALWDYIQQASLELEDPMLCCTSKDGLYILTDTEAVHYKATTHQQSVKRLYRILHHLHRIDQRNLTKAQIQEHEREIVNQSRIVQAVKRHRRPLAPRPTGYTR